MEKQIREILESDGQCPTDLEKLLEKMAAQDSGYGYLLKRFRAEKLRILADNWPGWFSRLGWWFAKLLMYSALVCSLAVIYLAGKAGVDAVTYGLVGASIYYAIIQIFTPGRIEKEAALLRSESEQQFGAGQPAIIDEEKAD
ncbi:MAG: hypothetical protein AB1403_23160 [Candidatus Riflebacteria bacterium]